MLHQLAARSVIAVPPLFYLMQSQVTIGTYNYYIGPWAVDLAR
jgi:hypothetical protein